MRNLLFSLVLLLATNAWGAGDVVLVSSVKGGVTLEAIGSAKTPLEPFLRLRTGDRLNLPANAQVSLVYFDKGRQEIWSGSAILTVGESESQKVSGNAEVQFKQLPPQITKQMNRSTPAPDGKVGMVRLRSIGPIDAMTKLENTYKELRAKAAPEDVEPELYWLAGLFEQREYLRLESELERLAAEHSDNNSLKMLQKLYTRAIANARQSER